MAKCGEYVNKAEAPGSRHLPDLKLKEPDEVLLDAVAAVDLS